jgi:hypothetical protein
MRRPRLALGVGLVLLAAEIIADLAVIGWRRWPVAMVRLAVALVPAVLVGSLVGRGGRLGRRS